MKGFLKQILLCWVPKESYVVENWGSPVYKMEIQTLPIWKAELTSVI